MEKIYWYIVIMMGVSMIGGILIMLLITKNHPATLLNSCGKTTSEMIRICYANASEACC